MSTTFKNHQFSSWAFYGAEKKEPEQLIPVERRKNILMINNELFEFNKPGFCREGQDATGQYRMCIVDILPHYKINETTNTDSVFVFKKIYSDDYSVELMISAGDNIIVSKQTTKGERQSSDQLTLISEK